MKMKRFLLISIILLSSCSVKKEPVAASPVPAVPDVKDVVDIVGADGIVDAFEIATALPETIEKMNLAISSYSSEFGLDENSDAKDVIESVLKSSDIPPEFFGDYKEYVRYKL